MGDTASGVEFSERHYGTVSGTSQFIQCVLMSVSVTGCLICFFYYYYFCGNKHSPAFGLQGYRSDAVM